MIPLRVKEYIQKKVVLDSPPIILNIEVTNACNLNCTICPSRGSIKKGFLDLDLLKKIIRENKDVLENQCVWLHYSGEPLLHPDLPKILEMFRVNHIETRLSTNATLLTEDAALKIMEAGLGYIVFSVDGYNKETYEKIRKGADFDMVEKNILNFLRIKKRNNFKTKTQIQFIKISSNWSEQKSFIEKWKETDIDCINVKSFSTRAGRVEEIEKFVEIGKVKEKIKKRLPCFYPWETLVVLWDGRVITCCQDLLGELVIGDIKSQTLRTIWNSTSMINLRKKQLTGDFSMTPCASCPDWKKCSTSYPAYMYESSLKFIIEKLGNRMLKDEGINIIFNKK